MSDSHGKWIWYELMTSDAQAAGDFYTQVIGWQVGDQPEYREITTAEGGVGGMLQINADMAAAGARPAWIGYVSVDDVDAAVAAITGAGGRKFMQHQMPGIGEFAMVADSQGAMFYVMKPIPPADRPDMVSNAFAYGRPIEGHCAWNELATDDQDAAVAFYTGAFGWRQEGAMDMGAMGKYLFLADGAERIGAIMPRFPQIPVSAWAHYFRVPDIDAAIAAIGANGGQVVHGPDEIPGGDFSLKAVDPQGAAFALVGGRKAG